MWSFQHAALCCDTWLLMLAMYFMWYFHCWTLYSVCLWSELCMLLLYFNNVMLQLVCWELVSFAQSFRAVNRKVKVRTLLFCYLWFTLQKKILTWQLTGAAAKLLNLNLNLSAGLVVRRVTVREYTVLVFNQATQANAAWPSLCG